MSPSRDSSSVEDPAELRLQAPICRSLVGSKPLSSTKHPLITIFLESVSYTSVVGSELKPTAMADLVGGITILVIRRFMQSFIAANRANVSLISDQMISPRRNSLFQELTELFHRFEVGPDSALGGEQIMRVSATHNRFTFAPFSNRIDALDSCVLLCRGLRVEGVVRLKDGEPSVWSLPTRRCRW